MILKANVIAICLICSAFPAAGEDRRVTWTGWFSDQKCASGRAASGTFTATNPDCARNCIRAGAPAVFISEQAKAVLKVKGYAGVLDDLGYRLEIQGSLNSAGDEIEITNVKRLDYTGAACSRPKAAGAAHSVPNVP
jgi:hypothetical protein